MVMLYLITQLGNANTVTDTATSILPHAPRTISDYINDYRKDFIKSGPIYFSISVFSKKNVSNQIE